MFYGLRNVSEPFKAYLRPESLTDKNNFAAADNETASARILNVVVDDKAMDSEDTVNVLHTAVNVFAIDV